ncbi:alkaline phosphatase family protein [Candidatus Saccharibacteria bacterium]|nr:alkaline phosphatase family protein [Candidatus Saccharibacteria bacterium]
MKVKNDYTKTLTNVAASVQKYFDLPQKHNSYHPFDSMLEKYRPENVVIILFDGLGANILSRALPENSFLRQNLREVLTTVFPATTAAATSSIRTGLNPVEHGWIGWTSYIEPIDKIITLFLNSEKCHDDEICQEFLGVKKLLVSETVTDQINQSGHGKSLEITSFSDDPYDDLDDMLSRIKNEVKGPGKKYIYAYDPEPDGTMHEKGPDSPEVRALIKERDRKISKLATELHDTLLVVIADHGHIKNRTVFLEDYPELLRLMTRTTSIDQRAAAFKIKSGQKDEFEKLFNERFGNFYNLYRSSEVVKSHLFGNGEENPLFRPALGDFLAVAVSDVTITAPGDEPHVSSHAGYTDDEVLIPFIAKYLPRRS